MRKTYTYLYRLKYEDKCCYNIQENFGSIEAATPKAAISKVKKNFELALTQAHVIEVSIGRITASRFWDGDFI